MTFFTATHVNNFFALPFFILRTEKLKNIYIVSIKLTNSEHAMKLRALKSVHEV